MHVEGDGHPDVAEQVAPGQRNDADPAKAVVQGAFREAVRAAGIAKAATCHLEADYDIPAVLGHKDVSTTMIYAPVANTGPRGVKSRLDEDR